MKRDLIPAGFENKTLNVNTDEGEVAVTIKELASSLAQLGELDVARALALIIERSGSSGLKTAIDIVEIALTEPFVHDEQQVKILEQALVRYPFRIYLNDRNLDINSASRFDVIEYWTIIMRMARQSGFSYGQISPNDTDSLIPASRALAEELDKNVLNDKFGHMPAALLNNQQTVDRFLAEIKNPISFLAVLVGQATYHLPLVKGLLESFNLFGEEDPMIGTIRALSVILSNQTNKE